MFGESADSGFKHHQFLSPWLGEFQIATPEAEIAGSCRPFFAGFWSATVKSYLCVPYLWRMFRPAEYGLVFCLGRFRHQFDYRMSELIMVVHLHKAMNYWTWCSVWNPWNKSKKLRIGIICDSIRGYLSIINPIKSLYRSFSHIFQLDVIGKYVISCSKGISMGISIPMISIGCTWMW